MTLVIHKTKDRICSREYRIFLTRELCAACGSTPCDPCHTITRKRADGSDLLCIPLCRSCHNQYDAAGKRKTDWLHVRGMEVELLQSKLHVKFLRVEFAIEVTLISLGEFEATLRSAGYIQAPYTKRKTRRW